MSSDEIRARALAIWAAAFVGMLPFGALLTAWLAAVIGPAAPSSSIVSPWSSERSLSSRFVPRVAWLGCAALPESCVAGSNPAAVAFEVEAASTL
jgi:hypothetical protein